MGIDIVIRSANRDPVALVAMAGFLKPEARANAALIVQAVNERAGLIAALRDLVEDCTPHRLPTDTKNHGVATPSLATVLAALRVLAQSDEPNKEGARP